MYLIMVNITEEPIGSMSQVVGLPNSSYNPITNTAWVRAWLRKLQKGCTRLAATSNKAYQLLAHGRWFSPGSPACSITKAEILLKVAVKHQKSIKKIKIIYSDYPFGLFKLFLQELIQLCNNDIDSIRKNKPEYFVTLQ